jgi:hypothetical protein
MSSWLAGSLPATGSKPPLGVRLSKMTGLPPTATDTTPQASVIPPINAYRMRSPFSAAPRRLTGDPELRGDEDP